MSANRSPSLEPASDIGPQEDPVEQLASIVEPLVGGTEPRRRPPKYRGLSAAPSKPPSAQPGNRAGESSAQDRSLAIEVRLMLERGGYCSVSLIAKRISSLPENLTVKTADGTLDLRGLQDDWYQDISLPDMTKVLRDGVEWSQETDACACRWLLSGREIYVLAGRADLRGFISQPCLELGREHAVLCSERSRLEVEDAIRTAGATPTDVIDSSLGAPSGWVVFTRVIPTRSVPRSDANDILNALRPLPEISINLEGGIRLEYTNWLAEHAPLIRVYGDVDHAAEVFIDGHAARPGENGVYRVPGYDSVGPHSVWCGGISKSYTIVPFSASWQPFDAYVFPDSGARRRLSICGPLVQEMAAEAPNRAPALLVPATNPIVVGAVPGQYAVAAQGSGVRGAPCLASPSFEPVWALPSDPLHSSKALVAIVLVGAPRSPEAPSRERQARGHYWSAAVEAWSRLILDAKRKRLRTEPDNADTRELWAAYARLARQIRRVRT
ncbi:MAG: hypothetical protein KJZ78_03905 [Bryobacteraceae bacterium]|nr:hypothetical protein [Bryobacteraceae bacterium]